MQEWYIRYVTSGKHFFYSFPLVCDWLPIQRIIQSIWEIKQRKKKRGEERRGRERRRREGRREVEREGEGKSQVESF